jgi:tetratricopeptide (TPR) repeat protein
MTVDGGARDLVRDGGAFARAGQWDQARDAYSRAVGLGPKNAAAHNNLAWLLLTCPEARLRDPARALPLAKKAVELEPTNGNSCNTLGVAHYRVGDWKAALEALGHSLKLREGGNSYDWFFLAMASWNLREQERARKWYAAAVLWMDRKAPVNKELRRFRAEAAALLGVPQRATLEGPLAGNDDVALYTLLLELVPGAPWAYSHRAPAYCVLGLWDRAARDFAELLEARPGDLERWSEYAGVLLLQGDHDGYRRVCKRVLERFGDSQKADELCLLAHILALAPNDVARPALAVQRAEKAAAAHPRGAWQRHTLALAHYRAGHFDQAVRQCRKSMTAGPRWGAHVVNWLLLALANQRLGHADEARQWLDRAVRWMDGVSPGKPRRSAVRLPESSLTDRLEVQLLRREAETLLSAAKKND